MSWTCYLYKYILIYIHVRVTSIVIANETTSPSNVVAVILYSVLGNVSLVTPVKIPSEPKYTPLGKLEGCILKLIRLL